MSPSFKLSGVEVPEEIGHRPNVQGGERVWSPQQQAVFTAVEDAGRGSLRVDAVAGAGKTTTLVESCRLMQGKVFFGAFNKRIADEIKSKVSGLSNVQASTMHAIGLRNWKQTAPNCTVDGQKLDGLIDELHIPYWAQSLTKFLVSIAKQGGFKAPVSDIDWQIMADHFDALDRIPEDSFHTEDDPFAFCNKLLQASIDCADEVIDFDDMLYMPLRYGSIARDYDWVLVDEAQDTNSVRRQLVARLLKPEGRVVAVGDPHQAIYGFTGADNDAMDLITQDFQCEFLPLTITYRCPKKVVEHARRWVSHITAADTAPEGSVSELDALSFSKLGAEALTARDVILCRNTRPIVSLALSLIRRGIGARVEGRDIGQSLLTLAGKWKTARSVSALIDKLEDYRERETRKLLARNQRSKVGMVAQRLDCLMRRPAGLVAAMEDKVDSLIAVGQSLNPGASVFDLKARINSIFGDTEPGQTPRVVTLSTVHKAKGREWDRVYLLGREQLMPSRWAKQDWELDQENNLIYVAVTRAKQELIEVEYDG